MSVKAYSSDSNGAVIDAAIASITAQIAAQASSPQALASLQTALDQKQREAVGHYLGCGRIHPGALLSGLGVSAANIKANADNGVQGTNLAASITTLTALAATAGPSQSDAAQRLIQCQNEVVQVLLAQGTIAASSVLSTLS